MMPTDPSIHDGWTPEPQEQVQPGDPWLDSEALRPWERLRLFIEELSIPEDIAVQALADLAALTPAGPEERGEGLRELVPSEHDLYGDVDFGRGWNACRSEFLEAFDHWMHSAPTGPLSSADEQFIASVETSRAAATPSPDTGAEERLRAALDDLFAADMAASLVHDYIWQKPVLSGTTPPSQQQASDAIWTIHRVLRPLLPGVSVDEEARP